MTRTRILEIATEQFSRYGVRAVTMEDIARQGGISKKTIYLEFADKKVLVKEAFEVLLEEDRKKLQAVLGKEDGVIEHLVRSSRVVRERLQQINPVVFMEVQRYFPEAWRMFEEYKVQVIMEDLVNVIEKGKALGYFRPEIDSQILAKVRINQITSTFDPENISRQDYNPAEEQMVMLDHFLHGIFTEKGRAAYTAQQAIED
ncbi:TetR/AcrR family transcriptional regulator [Algoriphagus oliviformis]|uniref:TetR/AcrR family transcriptional regulator n=1 Tax=Algoriphagus oliviformis TaxID=2811231 RepID=UPI00293D7632|nr:TetR/AcrR family transcriptional regulator [Algoriphagus oliviformis]